MWGCISTDFIFQPNFSTGFSSLKSDTVIHLAQWQYWWWFWFTFVWSLYFFFINKTIRSRVLKMKPRINTSYRSHGKWGDFLACIIPTIWCFNILVNSSFILRLMEWQNESSLFTVRIRGRQWYWVYKFELRNIIDLMSVPKNIGWNKWVIQTGNSLEVTDDYFFALKLRAHNNWLVKYWKNFLKNFKKYNKNNDNLYIDFFNFKEKEQKENNILFSFSKNSFNFFKEIEDDYLNNFTENYLNQSNWENLNENISNKKFNNILNKKFVLNKKKIKYIFFDFNYNFKEINLFEKPTVYINLLTKKIDYSEFSRFTKKKIFEKKPVLVTKSFLINKKLTENTELLNIFFNTEKTIEKKVNNDLFFLTLKQKRYKRKKNIPFRFKFFKDEENNLTKKIKFSDKPYLSSNQILKTLEFEPTAMYRLLKKNKLRSETFSVQLSRRLLRTKKTLVLPAHINITLISNSYDVIHSWFIPALGIKIDCVPGRSTHHTFFCDSVGFYYGQCAEICGRYHHHMPIRLCIIPFEHFLVWWHHFGLPKLLFTENRNRFETDYGLKKFIW